MGARESIGPVPQYDSTFRGHENDSVNKVLTADEIPK
jgi:hypothetical protein